MSYKRETEVGRTFTGKLSKDNLIGFDALECQMHAWFGPVKYGPWPAVSGAGLNSKAKLHGTSLANWLPTKKKTGDLPGQRGGVIPPGWWIVLPEVLSARQCSTYIGKGGAPTDFSLKLVPYKLDEADGSIFGSCARGGFYIHGHSRNPDKAGAGSDGCILVPRDERKRLAAAVLEAGGAWLYVFLNRRKIDDMVQRQIATANVA
ncbi:MAG: hypothetical protein ABWY27_06525 [Telluria sp.]